jgi:hypothetical protein
LKPKGFEFPPSSEVFSQAVLLERWLSSRRRLKEFPNLKTLADGCKGGSHIADLSFA